MTTSTVLRRTRLLVLGLVAVLGTTLLGTVAHAHDVLIASEPTEGQVLTEPPEHITLTFNNDPLDVGSAIVVVDDAGQTVVEGEGTVEGPDVRLELDPPLASGEYEARWRVASSDGHPIEGTIPFTVDAPAAAPAEPTVAEAPTTPADPAAAATTDAAPEVDADPATPADTSPSGLAGLPTWLKIAVALAALAAVAGLIVLTTRRLRDR